MELMTKQGDALSLPKGYKQTEVGLIPEDWDVNLLSNVVNNISSGKSNTSNESGDYILYGSTGKIGKKFYYDYKGTKILVARVGANAGNLYKVSGNYCVSDNTLMLSFNDDFDINYFFYYLNYFNLNKLVFGSGQPLITGGQLKVLQIPVPSTLTEQKAIATALSDVDALITSLEQTITKKKAIKQGAMQQLLTPPHKGGKRLPGFSGEWVEKTLGDVGVCIRGVTYSGDSDLYPFDNSDSTRLLRSNNVFDKNIVIKNLQYVKKEKVKSHQIMKSKDILICMANGSKALVGKAGQFNGASMQYTFGAFMGIFRPNIDEWDGDFLFNLFSTNLFRCHLDIQLSGSSINNLNPSDIEDFKFHIPSNPEQKAIAQILSDMDAEITQLETKKEKYQAIKQGMMQELLTGKTRLV